MPITKSAKKALRQSKTRRTRNLSRINAYKSSVKQLKKLVLAGKLDDAKKLLPKVYQTLDKASKAGVIKPNKAARLKSHAILSLAKTA
ncbi:30S ribosomal protein S20 [Candidatus Parcubacteria bacterium]|nr:30S ribosomal protein S20 [Candidatus Parcubacteria bacterium]